MDEASQPNSGAVISGAQPARWARALRGIGPALILLVGLFEWLEWSQNQAPYISLALPTPSMFAYMVICVIGLLVVTWTSGRHLKWSVLGLIPLLGPLLGLAVVVQSRPGHREQAQPPAPSWAPTVNVLLFMCVALLGLWFLISFVTFQRIQISKASPNLSARVVVQGWMNAIVYVQERRGMFLTSNRRVLWARDFAQVRRVIWSKDSSRILLVGGDSDTSRKDRVMLPNARGWLDALFVMYDRPSGKLWFNSRYRKEHPPFTLDDVRSIEWEEPVLGTDMVSGRK